MNIGNAIGKRIKELLFENKMSIYKLAKITCLRERTISNLINNRTEDVKMSTIYLISSAFNMDIMEFLSTDYFRNENIDL